MEGTAVKASWDYVKAAERAVAFRCADVDRPESARSGNNPGTDSFRGADVDPTTSGRAVSWLR